MALRGMHSVLYKKSQRSLNGDDMLEALKVLQSRSGEIFGSNTQKT